MTDNRNEALVALLAETEAAHGAYEATELNGVYDEDWPRWYATYAVDNGIGPLLGHAVSADDLAGFLTRSYAEFQATEPKPTESWASYTAGRIATEL